MCWHNINVKPLFNAAHLGLKFATPRFWSFLEVYRVDEAILKWPLGTIKRNLNLAIYM